MSIASESKAKPWLYGAEVCREIRVSPQTLEALVEAGHIRTLELPGVAGLRYSAEDVAGLLARGTIRRPSRSIAAELELSEA